MSKLKERLLFILLAVVLSLLLFWLSVAWYGWGNIGFTALNILLFGSFIFFIQYREKMERLPSSVYLAFVISLYAEMYGFPLTMYIFSWLLGYQNIYTLTYFLADLIGENAFAFLFHLFILPLSSVIMLVGMLLITVGWKKIHKAKNHIVTLGIYGHIRHPQFRGSINYVGYEYSVGYYSYASGFGLPSLCCIIGLLRKRIRKWKRSLAKNTKNTRVQFQCLYRE